MQNGLDVSEPLSLLNCFLDMPTLPGSCSLTQAFDPGPSDEVGFDVSRAVAKDNSTAASTLLILYSPKFEEEYAPAGRLIEQRSSPTFLGPFGET